jgi:hypothetical protein
MSSIIDRRQFAKLVGLGGVVFASGLGNPLAAGSARAAGSANDFSSSSSPTRIGASRVRRTPRRRTR